MNIMSNGKPSVTVQAFREHWRKFTSDGFNPNIGDPLPDDQKTMHIELGIIERFFPDTLECKFIFRDTLVDDGHPPIPETGMLLWNPMEWQTPEELFPEACTIEVDPLTQRKSLVPIETHVGVFEAIKGDGTGKGWILLGYVHMPGEGEIMFDWSRWES